MFESKEKRRESFWRELGAFTVTQVPAAGAVAADHAFADSSNADNTFGFRSAHAPSGMTQPLRIAVALLGHDISRALPSGHPKAAELTELLLAGLALRHGVSMPRIATFLPEMSALKFRIAVSKALSDPDTSAWYFENLEAFSERFRLLLERNGNRHPDDSRAVETPTLRHLPMMPVYQGGMLSNGI